MQIDSVDIDLLIPDPDNANTHDEKNLKAIRGSIKKFGMVEPLVVRRQNNVVLGGNGRLTVLKELGHTEAPVHYVDLDDQRAKALAIALNRTSELSRFDTDVLMKQLKDLQDSDFDIGEIGFDAEDIQFDVPPVEGLTDPDEVPENVETRCKPGDLWILGNHRLYCGDSTNVQHVERLMGGAKADMVFTDPPYGMNLDTDYAKPGQKATVHGTFTAKRKSYKPVIGDNEEFDCGFLLGFFAECREIFLFGADYFSQTIPLEIRMAGSWFVWDKRCNESADKIQGSAFELCWSKAKHKREILRIRNGIYGQKDDCKSRVHPTQKLVQVPQWFIDHFSRSEGDIVVDLFLGSGSTLIACEKTNRRCFGLEIDPHYASVIVERWEKFTGKKAELESQHG